MAPRGGGACSAAALVEVEMRGQLRILQMWLDVRNMEPSTLDAVGCAP